VIFFGYEHEKETSKSANSGQIENYTISIKPNAVTVITSRTKIHYSTN